MAKIIINTSQTSDVTESVLLNPNVHDGIHFNSFVESQKQGPKTDGTLKKKGITSEGAADLREKCFEILSHCNKHDATNMPETTHLVVGYVQSGKTMSFTALTALALDNGYRMVVYLAGTKNNLLDQTSKRLEKDLIRKDFINRDFYKLHKDPKRNDTEQIIGHLELSSKPLILIPILKHYVHIDELTELFQSGEFREEMEHETVLIIDDEADQASLNSYGRKNSKSEQEVKDASKTYESILRMRAVLPGNTYIQYTATPQANLLISMQDLLSPKSHTILNPGEGYVGGKLYFGHGPRHDLFNGRLIKTIPAKEVFHKKDNPLKSMPKSLKDALMFHILAVVIVVKYYRVEGVNYLSMMVHPDSSKEVNRKFKKWIDNQLKSWRQSLRKPDGHDDKMDVLARFEALFPEAISFYDDYEQPTFEEIRPLIKDVMMDYQTYLVNSDVDAQTEIDWDRYGMHILVGAEMLNRGFTVEKLATTYMPRHTKGTSNADTIQQRCRFFGYKMDYIKSCRVFLPEVSIIDYNDYVNHEEELRMTLEKSSTLAEAERKILLSPRLKPTRANVLPVTVVSRKMKGMHGMQAFDSKSMIESNTNVIEVFLDKHKDDFNILFKYNTEDRTHKGFKLSVDAAIELLGDFRFGNFDDAARKALTIRYLRYLSGMENGIEYIYFIQMACGLIRERAFNKETKQLVQGGKFFAGPSSAQDSTNYPGDQHIVGGDETLTIQLHHLFLGGAALDYARDGYTFAFYYPEQLAINYCANEANQEDDDEDDEESSETNVESSNLF